MIKIVTTRRQQQGGEHATMIVATKSEVLALTPDTVVTWAHTEYQHFEVVGGTRTLARKEQEVRAGEIPYLKFPLDAHHQVRKYGQACLLEPK